MVPELCNASRKQITPYWSYSRLSVTHEELCCQLAIEWSLVAVRYVCLCMVIPVKLMVVLGSGESYQKRVRPEM